MIFLKNQKTIFFYYACIALLQTSLPLKADVIDINQAEQLAKIFESQSDIILMGTSEHCHWCIQTKPHFIDLEKLYASKVNFYSVNGYKIKLQKFLSDFTINANHLSTNVLKTLKKHHALGEHQTLQIPGYPTFLYIKHGKIIDIHIGGCSKEVLEKFIKKNFAA